jgi:hypothetical protein
MTTIYEYYMNILVYEYNSMQRHTEVQIYDRAYFFFFFNE